MIESHSNETHAFASPSASKQWLKCWLVLWLKAKMEEEEKAGEIVIPSSDSDASREGTLAHKISELKLLAYSGEDTSGRLEEARREKYYTGGDMERFTDKYVQYVLEVSHNMKYPTFIEQRVSACNYVPQCYGTADCIVFDVDKHCLHIIDLKYGRGVPVSAINNPQLQIYALGALDWWKEKDGRKIKDVQMHIVQPRIANTNTAVMSVTDLLFFGDKIRKEMESRKGKPPKPTPGNHCQFCNSKARCTIIKEDMRIMEENMDRNDLTLEEIADLLIRAERVNSWKTAAEAYLFEQLNAGKCVKGWEIKEGRGRRVITDYDEAACIISEALGVNINSLWKTEPLSLTALTEMAGGAKALENMLGDLIRKSPGKPKLVRSED